MKKKLALIENRMCRRLGIDDVRFIEIEAKKRVLPEDAKKLRQYLLSHRKTKHEKSLLFFDQFLDTPKLDLLRLGASLRLRYKRNGAFVYLQYKGPGFMRDGVLYRSEFSTERLQHVLMEESRHDIVHFTDTSIQDILSDHVPPEMKTAMSRHLGTRIIRHIATGPIISIYQKDKFSVDLGSAYLEPSLDRIFAFHINPKGLHPLSSFCEFENEIKASDGSLRAKIAHLPQMLKFNAALSRRFDLRTEPLDKYHRCASFFLSSRARRKI